MPANTFKSSFKNSYEKSLNALPKYEDMKIGVEYALTVNVSDSCEWGPPGLASANSFNFDLVNVNRHIHQCYLFFTETMAYSDRIHIRLHTEISRKGRVHFHGYIKFMDKEALFMFYGKVSHNLEFIMNIKVVPITDLEAWATYCTKQKDLLPLDIIYFDNRLPFDPTVKEEPKAPKGKKPREHKKIMIHN